MWGNGRFENFRSKTTHNIGRNVKHTFWRTICARHASETLPRAANSSYTSTNTVHVIVQCSLIRHGCVVTRKRRLDLNSSQTTHKNIKKTQIFLSEAASDVSVFRFLGAFYIMFNELPAHPGGLLSQSWNNFAGDPMCNECYF